MTMPATIRAAAILVLAGCASAAARGDVTTQSTQTMTIGSGVRPVDGQPGVLTLTRIDVVPTDSLEVAPAPALEVVRAAYDAAGVPVTLADRAGGQVGNQRLVVRRKLGRTPLGHYLQCGQTITGSRADVDRIVMSVISKVSALPDGRSAVRTTVAAHAVDVSGNSSDPQRCTSTGALESRVHAWAAKLAAAR